MDPEADVGTQMRHVSESGPRAQISGLCSVAPPGFSWRAICGLGAATLAVLLTQATSAVAGDRYALIVAGASGGQEYAVQYAAWTRDLAAVLVDRMKIVEKQDPFSSRLNEPRSIDASPGKRSLDMTKQC